jgi:hypothetical protein
MNNPSQSTSVRAGKAKATHVQTLHYEAGGKPEYQRTSVSQGCACVIAVAREAPAGRQKSGHGETGKGRGVREIANRARSMG